MVRLLHAPACRASRQSALPAEEPRSLSVARSADLLTPRVAVCCGRHRVARQRARDWMARGIVRGGEGPDGHDPRIPGPALGGGPSPAGVVGHLDRALPP